MSAPDRECPGGAVQGQGTQTPGQGLSDKERQILDQRARKLAQPPETDQPAPTGVEYIAFRLSDERYGIESACVREVVAVPEVTWLPEVPDFVVGICNIRGKITSVVDLKRLLGLRLRGLSDFHTVIIARNGNMEMGLLVDHVLGTQHVALEGLEPALGARAGSEATWIRAITPDRLALLDAMALLRDPRLIVQHEV